MGGIDQLIAQLDPVDTNAKGEEFEKVCRWLLENDPGYQPLLRRIWRWKTWPGRKDIDAGVDLVAEDHSGNIWAIQAKAYNAAYSITRDDINKFIAESSRPIFKHRLLIGTTDKRHRLAASLMDDLDIPFIGLTQLRERDDYLDWPKSLIDLRPSKPLKPKRPHDYQRDAIKDVVKGFKNADRGQLIMACGTGKTLTAWFITEKLAAERTLVLVPSLSLLKQTMQEWRLANPKRPFAALPVCSDESVGSLGEDAAVSHTSDLGVPVTTDPEVIADFLRKRSGPRVVFSTYQSSPQIAAAFTLGRVPAFDLVIADEAHRVAGPVSSDFGTVLDPAAIKATRRLFMTATPRYFTGRVLKEAKDSDYEIASMVDHAKFGEVFHRLTFSQAIDIDRLTDYQVAIIGVDDATYREWAERGALVTLDGKKITDARSLAGQIGLSKAMRKFDLRRVISFHSRVKTSKDFAASMPAVLDWMPARQRPKGSLWSAYASGEMSAGERAVLIQHLKRLDDGERGLLANARCLSEGVDVPALDGVAFIDPRRSEVDIVQAVGRAIRKSDDKTIGTIVIPVFIDTDQDAEAALDSSAFKPVWDVIKALRAHDTALGEELDALRRGIGREAGKPQLPDKIHVDVPATVGEEFINAFEVRLVDATTAPWEFWYGLLQKYVAEHGHTRIPALASYDGLRLGQWVSQQRYHRNRRNLDPEREQRLESFPDWTWDAVTSQWEEGIQRLHEYAAQNGDCLVSQNHRDNDGYKLGQWVTIQRAEFRNGGLSQERRQRLEALPGWSWAPRDSRWETAYRRLQQYGEVHGTTRLVRTYIDPSDGYPIGMWAQQQRGSHSRGRLTPERIALLELLPDWVWDSNEAAFDDGIQRLHEYLEVHGDLLVPKSYAHDGYALGNWVNNQRSSYTKGKLRADYAARLEALPGWTWDALEMRWQEGFQHLADYAERHGGATPPPRYRHGDYPLGSWVGKQRDAYKRGTLDTARLGRLESLPGWTWDPFADKWEQAFEHLRDYVRVHGDARVPYTYVVDGYGLGAWASIQRSAWRNGKLSADRQHRLESQPGWVWETR